MKNENLQRDHLIMIEERICKPEYVSGNFLNLKDRKKRNNKETEHPRTKVKFHTCNICATGMSSREM
jgi:hypothetical protein